MGSYRRGLPKSGDIDLLLYHPNIKIKEEIKKDYITPIVNEMSNVYNFIGKIAKGKKKYDKRQTIKELR